MQFLKKLEHSFDFWFLLTTSVVFFLLRLPSFFEPYWYGDEGVYEVIGYGLRHGRLLYQGIWDNKPPLLYLIYAIFDGNQPYVKVASFVVGLLALFCFYALSKRLFVEKWSRVVATSLFTLLLGLPLLEGNIANAENFMIFPAVASAFLVIKTIQEKKHTLLSLFCAGLLLGLSFLIKVVAVFDFISLALVFGFVFFAGTKAIKKLFMSLALFSLSFFLPLIATTVFFAAKGNLHTFIESAFLSNVGYVNYANQLFFPFTHVVIPQGFLLIKLLIVLLIVGGVFLKRKSLSLTQLLVYTWLPFSLFNAFFSGRPWTHYMLVLLGSLCLLAGMLAQKKLQLFHSILLLLTCVLLAKNFWFYSKTTGYYINFLKAITNRETVTAYQTFFDKSVSRDYALSDFLTSNLPKGEHVFLWTNSPQLYYLMKQLPLGRYTVAYHITASAQTLAETQAALNQYQPLFIVVLPDAPTFPFATTAYRLKVDVQGGLIYERVF